MKKKLLAILLILSMLMLSACSSQSGSTDANGEAEEANTTSEQTTVTFYGWGGSEVTNAWIDGYLTDAVAKKYNIKLERVGMNIDEILNLLLNEKQAGTDKGSIDIIWINGENFASAKENGLLFGPFASELENFSKYLDPNSPDVMFDFGVATEGYEVPFGKAQFVMVYDSSLLSQVPADHKALLEMAKTNPGKFTYPAPPDFTGSVFVRNIIYDIVGYEQFLDMDADYAKVKEAIDPAMDYLKELKPYLWNKGNSYPASLSILDNMYADGEVFMTMDYNPNSASSRISTGEFPKQTKTFIFDKGSIGNTHFVAIAFNSSNVKDAQVVINEIISVEAQATKYDPSGWGDLPVLDNSKLSAEEKKVFDSIPLGKATLPQDILSNKTMPEIPAKLVPIIEQIWMEIIATESN